METFHSFVLKIVVFHPPTGWQFLPIFMLTFIFIIFQAPLTTFDCRKFFSRKRITISPYEFCVWDETGDDCAGDLATALFTIHNGRLFVVGLRSYAETDEEVRLYTFFVMLCQISGLLLIFCRTLLIQLNIREFTLKLVATWNGFQLCSMRMLEKQRRRIELEF